MKIGYVLDDRLDKTDGVQQYVKLVASWFKAHGHEVHYLVGDSPNSTEQNVHNLSRTVSVKFNKNRMGIPLPASKKAIKELLAREHFDILHVQMPYSPFLAGRVVAAAGPETAVIGSFHILPHGFLSEQGTRVLGTVLRRNKRRFDGFLSVTDAAQVFSKSHFGITSTISPNVVDLSKYQTGRPMKKYGDKQNIVFLGRLVTRKGAPYLLKAVDMLFQQQPVLAKTVRVIICGDGAERTQLEATAAEITKKTGAEIVFTGFLDEAEKPDYLATAQVAVYPSTGGESFGIVLIEAMGARAGIVIAGNNPGYSSVLQPVPEALFDPHSTEEFAALLNKSLSNKEFINRIHPKQQQLVRAFDISVVGPQLETYYRAKLAKREHKRDTN